MLKAGALLYDLGGATPWQARPVTATPLGGASMTQDYKPSAREHPITPPPGLVAALLDNAPFRSNQIHERDRWLIEKAYEAGADQELEACCEWLDDTDCEDPQEVARHLCGARRPKPLSLKELALEATGRFAANAHANASEMMSDFGTIRRALEQLPDQLTGENF